MEKLRKSEQGKNTTRKVLLSFLCPLIKKGAMLMSTLRRARPLSAKHAGKLQA